EVGLFRGNRHVGAGCQWAPPLSVPSAAGKNPAARPAPLPLDEPPQKWSRFHGLRAGGQGKSKDGPPIANSWVESLPSKIPPAASSRSVTAAWERAPLSARTRECAVVAIPSTSIMSLSA